MGIWESAEVRGLCQKLRVHKREPKALTREVIGGLSYTEQEEIDFFLLGYLELGLEIQEPNTERWGWGKFVYIFQIEIEQLF